MKKANWLFAVIFSCSLLALAGCHKQEKGNPAPVAFDLKIDLGRLIQILSTNSDAGVQESVTKIRTGLRYGYDYDAVLAELDKLNQSPAVTDAQKKTVAEITDQVKKAVSEGKPAQ